VFTHLRYDGRRLVRSATTDALIKRLDEMDRNLLAGFEECARVAEAAIAGRTETLLRMHYRLIALEQRIGKLEDRQQN
jgi:hypothetical protein